MNRQKRVRIQKVIHNSSIRLKQLSMTQILKPMCVHVSSSLYFDVVDHKFSGSTPALVYQ